MDQEPKQGQGRSRARKSLTCLPCRKRKVKCDFGLPCGQCRLRGKSDLCVYGEHNRWGYSNPQAVITQIPHSKVESCLSHLKEAGAFPTKDVRDALFEVYRTHFHPIFPVLDLESLAKVYESVDINSTASIEDSVQLLLLYSSSYRLTTSSHLGFDIPLLALSKLEETAHELILQLNPFQIQSTQTFNTFFFYAAYSFWADSPFYSEVCAVVGLLNGTLKGHNIFRTDYAKKELFGLFENCVALIMGVPSATPAHMVFEQDNLFLKCKNTLMRFRERVVRDIYGKCHDVHPQILAELEGDLRNAQGAFNGLMSHLRPYSVTSKYQLLAINSLSNQIALLLYRPYVTTSGDNSSIESELYRRKAQAMALCVIESAMEYFGGFHGEFAMFAFNDLLMGAFQASFLLAHDNFKRTRLECPPDTAESVMRFALRIPVHTSISDGVWKTGSTTWRRDVIHQCLELFQSLRVRPACRAARAGLILDAYFTEKKILKVSELFGPFSSRSNEDLDSQDELISAEFSPLYFTPFIASKNSIEFEQRCHEAIYENSNIKP